MIPGQGSCGKSQQHCPPTLSHGGLRIALQLAAAAALLDYYANVSPRFSGVREQRAH